MDLLEYQGKRYLARYGVPVSEGVVVETVDRAVEAAETVGYPAVVKAQVRIGGRGKAGGIKVVRDGDGARGAAEAILGMAIRGHTVRRLLIERAADIAHEHYASFTVDRTARRYIGIVSSRGGVDIEEVARDDPSAVARVHVGAAEGLSPDVANELVELGGIAPSIRPAVSDVLASLYRAFTEGDADLVEVNPLVVTGDGAVVALDAKVTLDDNAAYRHPEWDEWITGDDGDPRERLAREKGLNYVGLDGTVGIIGNGAGLVLSTLDVVNQVGGSAANFLDVGGGASADVVAAALEVVNADPKVRSILVNIFGGITRGEEVAKGIMAALERVELRSPLVVRLDGTNADEGRALLAGHESDRLVSRPTMLDAARTAVELAREEPR